jgi:hypothetical protein
VHSAIDYGCANCGAELDPRKAPERRPVPRRGGRNLPVCDECVHEIDAQTTLDLPERAAMAITDIALAPLGEVCPRNRCVWCGASCGNEKMRKVVVKAYMARAMECANQKRCMQRRRAQRTAA